MSRPAVSGLPAGLGVVSCCPDCETYYLDERRCPDCGLFNRRIDARGLCPHCDEPVALVELVGSRPTEGG